VADLVQEVVIEPYQVGKAGSTPVMSVLNDSHLVISAGLDRQPVHCAAVEGLVFWCYVVTPVDGCDTADQAPASTGVSGGIFD